MHLPFRKTLTATGIVLAMGAFGATAAADTAAENITEARQETQIWTTYALNPYLRATDLKVSVRAGKATLTGKVGEDVGRDLAKQIALGVSGVKEVDNQIVVEADYTPPARPAERSFGDVVDDATITAAVKSKLLWSKHADGLSTNVDTMGGKVKLMGTADSGAAKDLATRLAMNTRGVTAVDNRLVVKAAKPAAAASAKGAASSAKVDVKDSWITTKVKSTYMYSRNIDGSDISVSTKSGVVTLSGKVDSGAERALAIEFAENIRGVKSVESKGLTVSDTVATR